MIIAIAIAIVILSLGGVWYFYKRRPIRLSIAEILKQVALLLPLKNPIFKKYPNPTLAGDYFGFKVAMEGAKGFRFLATIELPQRLNGRIFLQSEERKSSLKPIAELDLVTTNFEKFDQHFLLMASDEKMGKAVFQPYLCERILTVGQTNWQLDVQAKEAHLDIRQPILDGKALSELFKVIVECLNALLVAKSPT